MLLLSAPSLFSAPALRTSLLMTQDFTHCPRNLKAGPCDVLNVLFYVLDYHRQKKNYFYCQVKQGWNEKRQKPKNSWNQNNNPFHVFFKLSSADENIMFIAKLNKAEKKNYNRSFKIDENSKKLITSYFLMKLFWKIITLDSLKVWNWRVLRVKTMCVK